MNQVDKVNIPNDLPSGIYVVSLTTVKSKKQKNSFISLLSPIEIDRVVQMAWEDRTPFEAIKFQFDLSEKDVIHLMKKK